MFGQYSHHHIRAWSAKIASFDGYVFVMSEYNHCACAALKNAIDFLYQERTNKAALATPSPWSLTLKNASPLPRKRTSYLSMSGAARFLR
jgi:NAD(P)H-dependent FMN reductase